MMLASPQVKFNKSPVTQWYADILPLSRVTNCAVRASVSIAVLLAAQNYLEIVDVRALQTIRPANYLEIVDVRALQTIRPATWSQSLPTLQFYSEAIEAGCKLLLSHLRGVCPVNCWQAAQKATCNSGWCHLIMVNCPICAESLVRINQQIPGAEGSM